MIIEIILIIKMKCVSITSCLGRNDYNVAFSILSLMILTVYYNQTPKITTKILIQIFVILSISDIIWIIYFSGAWTHLSEEEIEETINKDSKDIIAFWNSLWLIHGLVYFLAFIELILKGLLLYYLILDYKGKYYLLNLNYDNTNKDKETTNNEQNQMNNLSNDYGDFKKDIGTNFFDDNFHNEYE